MEAAAVVMVVVEGEVDESRVVRTLKAPWTARVGLWFGGLSASSGTLKEESRTSGRQRYRPAAACLHSAVVASAASGRCVKVGGTNVQSCDEPGPESSSFIRPEPTWIPAG